MKKVGMAIVLGFVLGNFASPRFVAAQETAQAKETDAAKASMELLEQAGDQLQQNHLDDAIELIESAIEKDPQNNRALLIAGQVYSRKGVEMAATDRKGASKPLRRGAELMRKLAEQKKDLSSNEKQVFAISVYNEACCQAIEGEADKAFESLGEAIKLGFDDADLMAKDGDFESIRKDDRFKELLASIPSNSHEADEDSEEDGESE